MFPAAPNLLSSQDGDAWIFADSANGNRFLVATNGPTLIIDIQRALASVMSQFSRGEFPVAFKHVTVVDYFTRVPVRITGRWDAATARAAMLLADGPPDLVRAGWAEVYRRRFGPALTRFSLNAWLNETAMSRRLRSDMLVATFPRETHLPIWGLAPSGDRTGISVRNLGRADRKK
jgi:hypothetical protein